jgi:hypothetical protein
VSILAISAIAAVVLLAVWQHNDRSDPMHKWARRENERHQEEVARAIFGGIGRLLVGLGWVAFQLLRGAFWLCGQLLRICGHFFRAMTAPGPNLGARLIVLGATLLFGIPTLIYVTGVVVRELALELTDALAEGMRNLEEQLPGHPGLPGAPQLVIPEHLWLALAGAGALMLGLLISRAIATEAALRSRREFVMEWPEGYDVSKLVGEFGAQLVGIRPRAMAWLTRRGRAIRFRFCTSGQPREGAPPTARPGLAMVTVSVADTDVAALRSAVAASMPLVDLVPIEEFDAPPLEDNRGRHHRHRMELELAHDLYALGQPQHAPFNQLAHLLAKADPQRRDRCEVLIDILPQSPAETRRERRKALKRAGELQPQQEPGQRMDAGLSVEKQLHKSGLAPRMSSPLVRFQVLVVAEAACEPGLGRYIPGSNCCMGDKRAASFARGVFQVFDQFAGGQNHWRARGGSLLGQRHLGADMPPASWWFDYRAKRGAMR